MCSGIAKSNKFMQITTEEVLQALGKPVMTASTQAFSLIKSLECNLSTASFKLLSDKQSFAVIAEEESSLVHPEKQWVERRF